MKKINQKGLTTVEILICFVLIAVISVSMYTTVSSYNNKEALEGYKEKIATYKNLLTKEIQDDLIKRKLVGADYSMKEEVDASGKGQHIYTHTVHLTFADGSSTNLIIKQQMARDYDFSDEDDQDWPCHDDEYSIEYGDVVYPIPNLGYGENKQTNCPNGGNKTVKVSDLRIQNVVVTTDKGVLHVKVDFYHVDLPSHYGINIVAPINYSQGGSTQDNSTVVVRVSFVPTNDSHIQTGLSASKVGIVDGDGKLVDQIESLDGNVTFKGMGLTFAEAISLRDMVTDDEDRPLPSWYHEINPYYLDPVMSQYGNYIFEDLEWYYIDDFGNEVAIHRTYATDENDGTFTYQFTKNTEVKVKRIKHKIKLCFHNSNGVTSTDGAWIKNSSINGEWDPIQQANGYCNNRAYDSNFYSTSGLPDYTLAGRNEDVTFSFALKSGSTAISDTMANTRWLWMEDGTNYANINVKFFPAYRIDFLLLNYLNRPVSSNDDSGPNLSLRNTQFSSVYKNKANEMIKQLHELRDQEFIVLNYYLEFNS